VNIATFNYLEAGLWFVLGTALVAGSCKSKKPLQQKVAWTAAAALLLFGVSDLIEAHTGAWWRPLWLLLMKAVCVSILVVCYLRYRSLTKS